MVNLMPDEVFTKVSNSSPPKHQQPRPLNDFSVRQGLMTTFISDRIATSKRQKFLRRIIFLIFLNVWAFGLALLGSIAWGFGLGSIVSNAIFVFVILGLYCGCRGWYEL